MANISDIRLSVDMTRAVGRSLVRAGVAAQLETNHLAANDQAPLTTCRACQGQAIMEVQHGDAEPKPHEDLNNLKGHPYWGKDRADQTSNGEEADVRPSANGRGPSAVKDGEHGAWSIGHLLHDQLLAVGVTSGYHWSALAQKSKDAYESAADQFLDTVQYTGQGSIAESQYDELAAARGTLERIGKALKDIGAPQNCDDATAIQRLAETHQRHLEEIRNNNRGFDNILAALKESGAVIDYGSPLQAAKDLSSEFKYLTDMYRKLDETLREIRDEIGEAVDVTDMETVSGAKRLVALYHQHRQNLDEVRREAALGTMRQLSAYLKASMQHVQPTETQL